MFFMICGNFMCKGGGQMSDIAESVPVINTGWYNQHTSFMSIIPASSLLNRRPLRPSLRVLHFIHSLICFEYVVVLFLLPTATVSPILL